MWNPIFGFVAAMLASSAGQAADLTATELRWLRGLWPVVEFARDARMPLDIVVQPQPTPGAAPLALGFVAGRCKLVLSMRGNAEAQATLERVEPALLNATLELMAAHELGHCRRYLDGAWFRPPAGFAPTLPETPDPESRAAAAELHAARREEAYGDLVGLAWTRQRHPQHYAQLQAWLVAERARDLTRGSPHDTLAWVRRAEQASALAHPSIFAAAAALWTAGLDSDD